LLISLGNCSYIFPAKVNDENSKNNKIVNLIGTLLSS
jgi:hypothetical protein